MRSTRRSNEPSRLFLLFDLAPDGGCLAAFVTKAPVVSYTTFSPLLLRAVYLCSPIHDLTTIQGLPGILLYGVRTFLTIKRAHLVDLSRLRIVDGLGKVKHTDYGGRAAFKSGYVETWFSTAFHGQETMKNKAWVLGRGTARRAHRSI